MRDCVRACVCARVCVCVVCAPERAAGADLRERQGQKRKEEKKKRQKDQVRTAQRREETEVLSSKPRRYCVFRERSVGLSGGTRERR